MAESKITNDINFIAIFIHSTYPSVHRVKFKNYIYIPIHIKASEMNTIIIVPVTMILQSDAIDLKRARD